MLCSYLLGYNSAKWGLCKAADSDIKSGESENDSAKARADWSKTSNEDDGECQLSAQHKKLLLCVVG